MSCLQTIFSAGIAIKPATLPSRRNRHAKMNVVLRPKATMVDGTSSTVRDVRPPITTFKPSMWGDVFSTFSFDDQVQQKYAEEIEALKKEARNMLMAATSTKQTMILIDKLERLALAYHFETEIEEKLQQVYNSREDDDEDYDLFATALRFRLLRQHQYQVSCSVFEKFIDKENKLKETLCSDVEGLLSLYEAAHVRIHDENILDEAVAITTLHLSRMLPDLDPHLKEKVQYALDYPLHKSLIVLHLRFHISSYGEDESKNELLLRLAKLNFNFLQNIYRNELSEVSTWWNKSEAKSLPYIRDRLVECYFCGIGQHFEPQYSCIRIVFAKLHQMFVAVDDTYDNYATLEEIELLTQALDKWNMEEADLLPDYIKVIYKFIMSVTEEFELVAEKQEKSFAIPYYIEAVKQACRGYAEEQKWVMERKMPTFEEFMTKQRIKALMYVTFIAVVLGIKSATKETIEWLLTGPKILLSISDTGRLLDDLASYQRESKGGKNFTFLDSYMKEKGLSKKEISSLYVELVEERWKDLNEEWVNCGTIMPKEIAVQFINYAQLIQATYKTLEDCFTDPDHTDFAALIVALLVDPIRV